MILCVTPCCGDKWDDALNLKFPVPRVTAVPTQATPEREAPCRPHVVTVTASGGIERDGKNIGSGIRGDFKIFQCSGDAIWLDGVGTLRRNNDPIGYSVKEFKIASATEDVAWIDNVGILHKNGASQNGVQRTLAIGGIKAFSLNQALGVVTWIDASNSIYGEDKRLGTNADEFDDSSPTGDVVWSDINHALYRNEQLLGRDVANFKISGTTGDVIWLDANGKLHKNEDQSPLGSDVIFYELDHNNGGVTFLDALGNLRSSESLAPLAEGVASFQLTESGISFTNTSGNKTVRHRRGKQ